jgi:integrase
MGIETPRSWTGAVTPERRDGISAQPACAGHPPMQRCLPEARRTCATLLVGLDVHPRIVMQILRHAQFDVTMEIYASASSAATREALKRLGASLDG